MIREVHGQRSNSGLGICFVFCAGPPGPGQKTTQTSKQIAYVVVAGTRAHVTLRAPGPAIPMIRQANDDWSNSGLGVYFVFWTGPPGPAQKTKQKPKHVASVLVAVAPAHLTLRAPGTPYTYDSRSKR
jgi:hypothetical protein